MSNTYNLQHPCFHCDKRCVSCHTNCVDLLFYNVFNKNNNKVSSVKNNIIRSYKTIHTKSDWNERRRYYYKRNRIHKEYLSSINK